MASRVRGAIARLPKARQAYEWIRGFPDSDSINQQLQISLLAQYRAQFRAGVAPFESISDAGFRCYSEFEEDGILLYALAAIGMKTRRIVEIGCGTGNVNMSSNLILNHGYKGYLFDGSSSNIAAADIFYQSKRDCHLILPELTQSWITRENVNQILSAAGAAGEVDVFSLDIDGNDWHIWDAIDVIQPRLCVFETNDIIPGDLSLTVPYVPDFDYLSLPENQQDFRSVSLLAMSRLSASKGYRLIGAHRHGFNVFFMRDDLGQELFPEVSIGDVHDNLWTRQGQSTRWPAVRDMGWQEV
ncbi:hypothetical protein [Mycobacterium sp. RTGN5]|uniref:hypothetical protein n=1 Tax=Mycobacterium sp. RTGN5 TaxID=3016522 RepID=UPI0029C89438|nr:hypothetical protein [Mycobacterium sp. RTGN5]